MQPSTLSPARAALKTQGRGNSPSYSAAMRIPKKHESSGANRQNFKPAEVKEMK